MTELPVEFRSAHRMLKLVGSISNEFQIDVDRCGDAMCTATDPPTLESALEHQFWRRSYVRSVYAMAEGVAYSMRSAVLEHHAESGLLLTDETVGALRERSFYWVKRKKEGRSSPRFLDLEESVDAAFTLFPRLFNLDRKVDLRSSGANALFKGSAVRNRLVHPKQALDLFVSNEEIEVVIEGLIWFRSELLEITRACSDVAAAEVDRLAKKHRVPAPGDAFESGSSDHE